MARRIRLFKQQQGSPNKLRKNISLSSSAQRWRISETTGRWERTPVAGRISNRPVQYQKRYEKERLESIVLPFGMCETDTDDPTITADPTINLVAPTHSIDIKHILMALREDMTMNKELTFYKDLSYKSIDIVIPSLKSKFRLWWKDPYLFFKKGTERPIKIPTETEDGLIPESTIDIICAIIEMKRLNG